MESQLLSTCSYKLSPSHPHFNVRHADGFVRHADGFLSLVTCMAVPGHACQGALHFRVLIGPAVWDILEGIVVLTFCKINILFSNTCGADTFTIDALNKNKTNSHLINVCLVSIKQMNFCIRLT